MMKIAWPPHFRLFLPFESLAASRYELQIQDIRVIIPNNERKSPVDLLDIDYMLVPCWAMTHFHLVYIEHTAAGIATHSLNGDEHCLKGVTEAP